MIKLINRGLDEIPGLFDKIGLSIPDDTFKQFKDDVVILETLARAGLYFACMDAAEGIWKLLEPLMMCYIKDPTGGKYGGKSCGTVLGFTCYSDISDTLLYSLAQLG